MTIRHSWHRQRLATILTAFGLFLFPANSWSFGQNKVQFENLSWKYHQTNHLRIYFHQNADSLPMISARWIEQDYQALKQQFGFTHRDPIPLLIYGTPNLFQQTNVIMELLPEGVGGFTELFKNRIVVPYAGSYNEYRHVIHHELVHAFEFGVIFDNFGGSLFQNAGIQLPLWFAEGLAEYLSTGWTVESDMFLMDRTVFGEVALPGPELNDYMAYKGGQSFLHYLAASRGDTLFYQFLHAFRDSRRVDASIEKTYDTTLEALGQEWKQELKRIYWPEIGKRENPDKKVQNLSAKLRPRASFNLRPRISPDGSKTAFFSDYKDFTKIVIVNREGKKITSIGQHGYGGYFESFHPFRSGMCWSPKADQLCFVTESHGNDEIRMVDITTKKLVKRLAFPGLGSITSPDWSPDGKSIVFTGISKGQSDVYLCDVATDKLTRLTNDISCESDPRFSRDGASIVFAREDTSGNSVLKNNQITAPTTDLFSIHLSTHSITQITNTPWDEKSPAYSADGKYLVFISNQNGIDNVYTASIDSMADAHPLTDYIGGCSNPDWARDSAMLVFGLFQKGSWHIYRMENPLTKIIPAPLAPTKWVESLSDTAKKFFTIAPVIKKKVSKKDGAKIDSTKSGITEAIDTAAARKDSIAKKQAASTVIDSVTIDSVVAVKPLPDSSNQKSLPGDPDSASSFAEVDSAKKDSMPPVPLIHGTYPYRLQFSPDLITVGMGISSIYGYAGQWMVALSDLMGDHRIMLAGDIQGELDKYAHVFGSYLNSKYRVDFGIGAFYSKDYTVAGGDGWNIDSLYHDAAMGGMLTASYPFSTLMRLQLDAYYSHVSRTPIIVIDSNRTENTATREFDILVPTLSWTFDNALWGMTGPVNGIRSDIKLTAIPPIPSLEAAFISCDFDVRHYWHIDRRFVWANRVTFGGSLPLSDSKAGRRYFLGGNDYWLNYRINPDEYQQNINNVFYSDFIVPFRGWDYFDITGERYAVLNTEFRFPFIRNITIAWPLPMKIEYINGAAFIDAGNAWDPEDQMDGIPLPKSIYGGVGFGLRANLELFVLRFDRAWKTDWRRYINSPISYFSLGADF